MNLKHTIIMLPHGISTVVHQISLAWQPQDNGDEKLKLN